MAENKPKPSPWTNPEHYEKEEIPVEPQREKSLREYIELKLSESGFAVDQDPEGILVWPRGRDAGGASYVIGERKNTYVILKATGPFSRKKTKAAMNSYLQQWVSMYNIGARK